MADVTFESHFSTQNQPLMDDHRILGVVIVPAVYHLELGMAAGAEAYGTPARLEDVVIHEALVLRDDENGRVVRVTTSGEGEQRSFQIRSRPGNRPDGEWTLHSGGKVLRANASPGRGSQTLADLRASCPVVLTSDQYYRQMDERLITLGARFRCIKNVYRNGRDVLLEIELPGEVAAEAKDYTVHPIHLDAAFQLLANEGPEKTTPYVPFSVESVDVFAKAGVRTWCHVRRSESDASKETVGAELTLFSDSGEVLARAQGMRNKRVPRDVLQRTAKNTLAEWCYGIKWAPRELTDTKPAAAEAVVIFADQGGWAKHVARICKDQGASVSMVWPAGGAPAGDGLSVDYNDPKQFEQLLARLPPGPKKILFAWPVDVTPFEQTTPATIETDSRKTCGALLYLVQALAKADLTKNTRLWVITKNAQTVNEQGLRNVAGGTIWGMGKVVGLEYPELWGGLMDLPPAPSEADAKSVFRELTAADREDHVAFRGGVRHTARVVPTPQPKPKAKVVLDPKGMYFIAGGLTGLGLKTAEWMVEHGAKYIACSGRRQPDAAANASIAAAQAKGATIAPVRCDITNAADVHAAFTELRKLNRPIRGIVQSAGVLSDGVIAVQTWETFWNVLNPKLIGSWNLYAEVKSDPIDLFCIYASVTSVLGWVAQPNYSAANSFQDQLAHSLRTKWGGSQSINWGPFSDVGMAADVIARRGERLYHGKGVEIITPEAGMDMLDGLFEAMPTQVGVHPINWSKFLQAFPSDRLPAYLSELGRGVKGKPVASTSGATGGRSATQIRQATGTERETAIRGMLQDEVAKVLGLNDGSKLDRETSLSDLGVDSVLAVELRTALVKAVERPVPATLLFDFPNLNALTAYFDKEIK